MLTDTTRPAWRPCRVDVIVYAAGMIARRPISINFNAIAPGVLRTDLNRDLLDGTERGRERLKWECSRRLPCRPLLCS